MAESVCYTLLTNDGDDSLPPSQGGSGGGGGAGGLPSVGELAQSLEKGDDEARVATMKRLLVAMANGEAAPLSALLMPVIRFVLPSRHKGLKKLLLLYWELVPKKNPDGKPKHEMILVCNAMRNDLQHPNEFIRGCTLRFLCKLRETEIIEPLIPSVRGCLEHTHPYVRRNALLAVYSIFKFNENLIPDATELVYNILTTDSDMSCKRNAFLMLYNCDMARSLDYLSSVIDQVPSFPESLQLVILELIRKVTRTNAAEKPKYIKCIFDMLTSSSNAVKFEAAATLMSLSQAPTAVKAAATCYISLILKESDNNVKLIVLERINELREKHDRILDDSAMDILRVLASPDIEVRQKCLATAMQLVSVRNVQDVVSFLKKEITKTYDQEYEKNVEYRQLLIHAIHQCAIKFPEVASSVIHTLMEFLGDANEESAVNVILFVREVMERFPNLRPSILEKLLDGMRDFTSADVFGGAFWVIGEYCTDIPSIDSAMDAIRKVLGEVPILAAELREAEELAAASSAAADEGKSEAAIKPAPVSTRVAVLADGTYATQSALSDASAQIAVKPGQKPAKPPLRLLLLEGKYYVGTTLAAALTKMALRYSALCADEAARNHFNSEAMLIMASIVRLGQSNLPPTMIDEDSFDRIMVCIRTLAEQPPILTKVFQEYCRKSFAVLLNIHLSEQMEKQQAKKTTNVEVDDAIKFRQLQTRKQGADGLADQYESDLTRATGEAEGFEDLKSKLNRIVQLTGHSDPVYAEAFVNVHQYDILLDVLVVNQTSETLQNVSLELATLGDLKLVERPTTHMLGPHDFLNIKTNIKVSSTESGVIFGNIVYDTTTSSESHVVILNDIHIDIMDYINPAACTPNKFRQMWADFEWENKVLVNTSITDLREYLQHILSRTNMACLTPEAAMEGDCAFLAVNLYARSIFGEDALANLCIERAPNGKISGAIRIRSKTQGIALSLGDKITLSQKNSDA